MELPTSRDFIKSSKTLLCLCFAIILIQDCVQLVSTKGLQIQRGFRKTCGPVFNCPKNHYIKECEVSGANETCEPCKHGYVQPNVISSLDEIRSCFIPDDPNECPKTDTVFVRNRHHGSCQIKCKCSVDKCYYGNPCFCDKKYPPCEKGKELNVITGNCDPCPELKYKNEIGCEPCKYNVTAYWLKYSEKVTPSPTPTPTLAVPKPGVTTTKTPVVKSTGKTVVVTNVEGQGEQTTPETSEESMTPTVYIITPVILLIVIIVIAVTVVICCRRNNGMRRCQVKHLIRRHKPGLDAENGEAVPLPAQGNRDAEEVDNADNGPAEMQPLNDGASNLPPDPEEVADDTIRPFVVESPDSADSEVPPLKVSNVRPIEPTEQEESPSNSRNRSNRPRVTIPNPNPLNDDHVKTPIADTSPHDYGQRPVYSGFRSTGKEPVSPTQYPPQEAIIDSQPSSVEDSVGPSPGSNISDQNYATSSPGSPTQCTEDLALSGATGYTDEGYVTDTLNSRHYVPGAGPLEHEEDTDPKCKNQPGS